MRANAEAAGFNPLTALRAGGGAGFTTTHHPSLASGGFMADALSSFGSALSQAIDPMNDATAKLEFQIKQETLKNLQADTAARKRASLGGVPVSTGARKVASHSPLGKTVTLDGFEYRGSGKNGEIEDLWNVYKQPDGSYIRLPNPNIADSEQFLTVPLAKAENVTTRPISSRIMRDGGWIRSRELTKAEKDAAAGSWWPSWLPSVGIQFNEKKAK